MASNRTRRVIAQQWISVDGYAAGPADEQEIFAAVDDFTDSESHNSALLEHVDEVLLGRRSYETFAAFWPLADDQPMAATVNRIPKVVCSATLREAPGVPSLRPRSSPTRWHMYAAGAASPAATFDLGFAGPHALAAGGR